MAALRWFHLLLIAVTLVGVAVGRYPRLRMNRATIALVGATALVLSGAISLADAFGAVDLHTLALLLAMMILNGNLRLAGFLPLVTGVALRWAGSPRQLLALLVAVSGCLSAVFLNDTIVLVLTPLVLEVTARLRRNPIPYLVALVTAANVGSVATIVGNPQNMLIGLQSGISFAAFTAALAPLAIAGLVVVWAVVLLVYRAEFRAQALEGHVAIEAHLHRPLLAKGLAAAALMMVALFAGAQIALAALAAAAFLLVTRRLKPQRVFREIDVSLLVFFASLFVVTRALETAGFAGPLFDALEPVARHGLLALTAVAVLASNLVSNVPAVLLLRPAIASFPDPESAWLGLAMATTFAGNLTLLGSVANLIVAEIARDHRVHLGFREYLRAGVPITLLTLGLGVLWLRFLHG